MTLQEEIKDITNYKIVHLEEYKLPEIPLEVKMKQGFSNFFASLNSQKKTPIYKPYNELTAFSKKQIDQIVPYPRWREEIAELNDFLLHSDKTKLL